MDKSARPHLRHPTRPSLTDSTATRDRLHRDQVGQIIVVTPPPLGHAAHRPLVASALTLTGRSHAVRRIAIILALLVVSSACTNNTVVSTTLPQEGDTPVATTATSTTAPSTTTTTIQAVATGPTDCLEIWPEAVVQSIAGSGFTFFDANETRDACTYWDSASGIALAWQSGDRSGFELSKSLVGATAAGSLDISVCDIGFYTELEGGAIIMEAHSDAQGRTYTATISDDGRAWAVALLDTACQGEL